MDKLFYCPVGCFHFQRRTWPRQTPSIESIQRVPMWMEACKCKKVDLKRHNLSRVFFKIFANTRNRVKEIHFVHTMDTFFSEFSNGINAKRQRKKAQQQEPGTQIPTSKYLRVHIFCQPLPDCSLHVHHCWQEKVSYLDDLLISLVLKNTVQVEWITLGNNSSFEKLEK